LRRALIGKSASVEVNTLGGCKACEIANVEWR